MAVRFEVGQVVQYVGAAGAKGKDLVFKKLSRVTIMGHPDPKTSQTVYKNPPANDWEETGMIVVAVDGPKNPEHVFPPELIPPASSGIDPAMAAAIAAADSLDDDDKGLDAIANLEANPAAIGPVPTVYEAPVIEEEDDEGGASPGDGESALEALRKEARRSSTSFYQIGFYLTKIRETQVFVSLGYEGKRGWNEFLEKELGPIGLTYRRAMYAITIYRAFSQLGKTEGPNAVQQIGWAKAAEITRLTQREGGDALLQKHFPKLLAKAEELTRDQLAEYIRDFGKPRLAGKTTPEPPIRKAVTLRMSEKAADLLGKRLMTAREALNVDTNEEALDIVMSEWLLSRMHGGSKGKIADLPLEALVAALESRYGVTVTTRKVKG
jgi:hypothetical protein